MKVKGNVSIVSIDISKIVSHQMYVTLGHSSNILDTPIPSSGPSIRAVTSWTNEPLLLPLPAFPFTFPPQQNTPS